MYMARAIEILDERIKAVSILSKQAEVAGKRDEMYRHNCACNALVSARDDLVREQAR